MGNQSLIGTQGQSMVEGENHIKLNKDFAQEKLSEINSILNEYASYRDIVTEYIFDNKSSFEGKSGESFRNKVIEVNIVATDSMNILQQYMETFISYHDHMIEVDEDVSKDFDTLGRES
ncbi:hypothetical protein [uncultured Clostridium sp.]|jgi:uncharacterized protein YukE|uniref:hypothetical protein n=1 Tax=uncultured Clostridium sp. TaxID=59620 RepID=UPI00262DAF3E|nr:hypothetical protein [uncultured Clostridium sp.]